MARASCLCGDVTWRFEQPPRFMVHCHCGRCRKAHGTAFATYVGGAGRDVVLAATSSRTVFNSSPGFARAFCARCGSVVATGAGDEVRAPAGCFLEDPGIRPQAHIFVGSNPAWFDLHDALPRYEAHREDLPTLPDRPPLDPPGPARGSCLCGAVAYVIEGTPLRAYHCLCGRCQRARAAAHASNLFAAVDGVRFTRGADHLTLYKLPQAQHFSQAFCRTCGSKMPRLDAARGMAIVPMGGLDDEPGVRPQRYIFTDDTAAWFDVPADGLPRDATYPTA